MYQLASRITCEESVWRNSSGEIIALFLYTIFTLTTVLFVRDDDEDKDDERRRRYRSAAKTEIEEGQHADDDDARD